MAVELMEIKAEHPSSHNIQVNKFQSPTDNGEVSTTFGRGFLFLIDNRF